MSTRRNRISANRQYIRVWFDYLKLALEQKLKVDRQFYRKWHVDSIKDEIDAKGKIIQKGVRFDQWWKEHKHLFTIKTLHTIRIDTRLSMNEALKECRKKLEGKVGQSSEFRITAQRFRYVEIDDYLKVLQRRLKPNKDGTINTHQSIRYDIEYEYHKKDLARAKRKEDNKQINTIKRKMQRIGHNASDIKRKSIDRESMRRVQYANKILDNVCHGVFPGKYYIKNNK